MKFIRITIPVVLKHVDIIQTMNKSELLKLFLEMSFLVTCNVTLIYLSILRNGNFLPYGG